MSYKFGIKIDFLSWTSSLQGHKREKEILLHFPAICQMASYRHIKILVTVIMKWLYKKAVFNLL